MHAIMTWNSAHHWPFVQGIYKLPVVFQKKGPVMHSFGVSFVVSLNNCDLLVNSTFRKKLQLNFNEETFYFKTMHLKVSPTKCWPFCSCSNVLLSLKAHADHHTPMPSPDLRLTCQDQWTRGKYMAFGQGTASLCHWIPDGEILGVNHKCMHLN